MKAHLNSLLNGAVIVDVNWTIQFANPTFIQMVGLKPKHPQTATTFFEILPAAQEILANTALKTLQHATPYQTVEFTFPNGTIQKLLISIQPFERSTFPPTFLVYIYEASKQVDLLDSFRNVVYSTRLYPRQTFLKRLETEIEIAGKTGASVSMLLIDLDYQFSGDAFDCQVLEDAVKAIQGASRASDMLCRLGEGLLAVLLLDTSGSQAVYAGEEIRQEVEAQNILSPTTQRRVTVSVGVSTYPEQAKFKDQLIQNANAALERAKVLGKNRVQIYLAG